MDGVAFFFSEIINNIKPTIIFGVFFFVGFVVYLYFLLKEENCSPEFRFQFTYLC